MEDRTAERGSPDPTGLSVARHVQEAVAPDTVILFGSRAKGTHRPDSDVDIMIVCLKGTTAPYSKAHRAAREYFNTNPPTLSVEIIAMDRQRFDYCRRARNHVAGQAIRDGIVMSGERLHYSFNYEDDYPESWPDVREKLLATHRHMGTFQREITHPDGEQENYGFHAQQAVENSIKAWLSAADVGYEKVHDLQDISNLIFNNEEETNSEAGSPAPEADGLHDLRGPRTARRTPQLADPIRRGLSLRGHGIPYE